MKVVKKQDLPSMLRQAKGIVVDPSGARASRGNVSVSLPSGRGDIDMRHVKRRVLTPLGLSTADLR